MRLVILESPYAGEVDKHLVYARLAMRDCLLRGEAPYASHLLYTQPGVLDDKNPEERRLGIDAGLAWGAKAEATVVYVDLGISSGMREGIRRAHDEGRPVEMRIFDLADDWRSLLDPNDALARIARSSCVERGGGVHGGGTYSPCFTKKRESKWCPSCIARVATNPGEAKLAERFRGR